MKALSKALALVLIAMAVPAPAGADETPSRSGNAVFDRVVDIVRTEFYRPAELGGFDAAVSRVLADTPDLAHAGDAVAGAKIDEILASLKTSHTARFTPDSVAYYELLDVFRFNYRRDLRRLYPPDGEITYDGIGITTARVGGTVFVSDVYDGGPAARANIKPGDEIVALDGAPFAEIDAFRGKAGREVILTVRRKAGGPGIEIKVRVERLQPSEALLDAISGSVRVFTRGNRQIGYVRIWSYTRDDAGRILSQELGGGRLAHVDGLVLDLRSRWGGAPADAAELFVGGTPDMEMIDRDGDVHFVNGRWRKPVVAIIDEGTRSGMEIFANALKVNGIKLVGTKTAGDVVGGRGFLLPDDSLLILAVVDVRVGGRRLEGHPVTPDIDVPFDYRYSGGADPLLDAAIEAMVRRLSGG